jgi:hypothetical protein
MNFHIIILSNIRSEIKHTKSCGSQNIALLHNLHILRGGLTASKTFETLQLTDSEHIYSNAIEYESTFESVWTFIKGSTRI